MVPEPGIVMLNLNLKEDTAACVQSFLEAGAVPEQIILVDNGSSDGSVEHLRKQFGPGLDLQPLPENIGFVRGSNLGIRRALEKGCEWVLLVNNDTIAAPDLLEKLFEAARLHPEYDLFGPLILYYDQPRTIWFLGDQRLASTLLATNHFRGKSDRSCLPEILTVDYLSGCCLLIRKRVLDQIKGFDPKIFMYGEDVDFCWRAQQAGFKQAAVPGARLWHKISTSSKKIPVRTRYLRILNQIRFYRSYSKRRHLPLMILFTMFRVVTIAAGDLFKHQVELIRPAMAAWFKGWFRPESPEDQVYGTNHL